MCFIHQNVTTHNLTFSPRPDSLLKSPSLVFSKKVLTFWNNMECFSLILVTECVSVPFIFIPFQPFTTTFTGTQTRWHQLSPWDFRVYGLTARALCELTCECGSVLSLTRLHTPPRAFRKTSFMPAWYCRLNQIMFIPSFFLDSLSVCFKCVEIISDYFYCPPQWKVYCCLPGSICSAQLHVAAVGFFHK